MSEKTSRAIFIGELIVIVLPLSLLLLIATLYQIYWTINFFIWHNIANTLFALLACTTITSGLILSRTFIKQGISGLHNQKPFLSIFSFLGLLLSIASGISIILPPSPEYSQEEMFRDKFEGFILGIPILIPLVHLILERHFRKEERKI